MRRFYQQWVAFGLAATIFGLSFEVAATNPPEAEQARQLSPQAQISLITCSPSEDLVFTVYGHTSIRVYDPVLKINRVFNYGSFDWESPNFVYRFAKGETDYYLSEYDFRIFMIEYYGRGSEVYEQVLNLLPIEKEALWQALLWNEKVENRVYRYNFFFDNCATRPLDMIENNLQGEIRFARQTEFPTFRDVINYCTRNRPWQTFGCDLVLGLPTDRLMTQRETFFIPTYLKDAFEKAEIIREGKSEPLVLQRNLLAEEQEKPSNTSPFLPSPLACFSLLFLIILALTFIEWRWKTTFRIVNVLLFLCAGIAGCIIFFLSFFSEHPATFPNIALLWLHPLHLVGICFFVVKKWRKLAFCYHFINFAAIIIMSAGWIFIPQHFNIAFIPLITCLLLRSGWAIIRKKTIK